MELEEFASLQLDKPLPDVRVCNINMVYQWFFNINILIFTFFIYTSDCHVFIYTCEFC